MRTVDVHAPDAQQSPEAASGGWCCPLLRNSPQQHKQQCTGCKRFPQAICSDGGMGNPKAVHARGCSLRVLHAAGRANQGERALRQGNCGLLTPDVQQRPLNRKQEAEQLQQAVALLRSSPGRLTCLADQKSGERELLTRSTLERREEQHKHLLARLVRQLGC